MAGDTFAGRRPRILVTGFSVFPGAPVNPTEALIADFHATPPDIDADLRFAVLDVEYATIAAELAELCTDFAPDIAIHFGLARECRGFRLERLARNTNDHARPDNAGAMPREARICAGPDTFPSTLPLDDIATALTAENLPVEWSDDAGGYLCNTVFTLSAAKACDGLAPQMTGFIHVPPLDAMPLADLRRGAATAIKVSADLWTKRV